MVENHIKQLIYAFNNVVVKHAQDDKLRDVLENIFAEINNVLIYQGYNTLSRDVFFELFAAMEIDSKDDSYRKDLLFFLIGFTSDAACSNPGQRYEVICFDLEKIFMIIHHNRIKDIELISDDGDKQFIYSSKAILTSFIDNSILACLPDTVN